MSTTTTTPADADPKTYQAMNVRERNKNSVLRRGTARRDTVKRILRNGWTDATVCRRELTDDYKRDMARNYDRGPVSPEYIIDKMETTNPKHCWVEQRADGREVILVCWSRRSYEITLDTRQITFDFGIDEDEGDGNDTEQDLPEPAGTPGEVFEQLETGATVIWDEKEKPLEVVVGYEKAKSAQPDNVSIEPTIHLEGPRGGAKILQRSDANPDTVTVTTRSLSTSQTTISGLRVLSEADN